MTKKIPDGEFCPFIDRACVREKCKQWTSILGTHPQTNAPMNMQDCAIKWLPVLMIDTSKEVRQAAAAVESFRNESVKGTLAIENGLRELGQRAADMRALPDGRTH